MQERAIFRNRYCKKGIYIIDYLNETTTYDFCMGIASSRSTDQRFELPSYNAYYYEYHAQNMFGNNVCDGYEKHGNKYHDMVTDAFHEVVLPNSNRKEPNIEAKQFYNMLDAAKKKPYKEDV